MANTFLGSKPMAIFELLEYIVNQGQIIFLMNVLFSWICSDKFPCKYMIVCYKTDDFI